MEIVISDLIWGIVNFLVLFGVLTAVLYKPLVKTMDKRKNKIVESLKEAEEARKEVAETQNKIDEDIRTARQEAKEIIEKARKDADQIKENLIADAHNEVTAMHTHAEAQIVHDKKMAMDKMRSDIAHIVILAAGKALQQTLTEEQQKAITDKYIKEVGEI